LRQRRASLQLQRLWREMFFYSLPAFHDIETPKMASRVGRG
jgi:hypothetical protein